MATNVLPVGGTEQSQLVTVVVNGASLGTWDTFEGGDTAAPSVQNRAGGQKNMTSYATLPKYASATVSRVLQLTSDWELSRSLKAIAGLAPASITLQPLDATRNVYGNSQTCTGLLLSVKEPRVDSNSDSLQTWSLEISVDGWQ